MSIEPAQIHRTDYVGVGLKHRFHRVRFSCIYSSSLPTQVAATSLRKSGVRPARTSKQPSRWSSSTGFRPMPFAARMTRRF